MENSLFYVTRTFGFAYKFKFNCGFKNLCRGTNKLLTDFEIEMNSYAILAHKLFENGQKLQTLSILVIT